MNAVDAVLEFDPRQWPLGAIADGEAIFCRSPQQDRDRYVVGVPHTHVTGLIEATTTTVTA